MADVVVVGAGPVGLWTAIQAKIQNNNLRITILDKYADYQRKQALWVDPKSLLGVPDHEELKKICDNFKEKKLVPIQEMQEALAGCAKALGIKFKTETFEDPSALKTEFPDAQVFIGADGAYSKVRETVFGNVKSLDRTVQRIVQVSYKTKTNAQKLNQLHETSMKVNAGTFVQEHAKGYGVALRFFVTSNEYKRVKDAKARTPWTLDNSKIPESLKKGIEDWIRTRKQKLGEEIDDTAQIQLTAVPLHVYSARRVVAQDKDNSGVTWCLVGDAAGGVPYFRSLNKGLLEGTRLASVVARVTDQSRQDIAMGRIWRGASYFTSWWKVEGNVDRDFAAYATFVSYTAVRENIGAFIKSIGINLLRLIFAVTYYVTPTFVSNWVKVTFLDWEREGVELLDAVVEPLPAT